MSKNASMRVNVKSHGSGVEVNIEGIIKSVADSESFKEALNSVCGLGNSITVNILDSFAITSTIIGYLNKKVRGDKENIVLNVADQRLYDLFSELNLIETLKVRKISSN